MLSALRSALFILWMAVTVVPWALAVLVASLFLRGDRIYWMCVGWLRTAMWGCRVICGVRSRIHGMDNLPPADRQSPVILLSKHQSTWETFTYPAIMSHPLAYVFKRELLYIPFFGWAMGRMDMIHIDRSKRNEAFTRVVEQGQRILANGSWIIMFPEGTRIARGQQGNYKTGGTRLAVATGAPVVPIAVSSARCWPRKSLLVKPGVIDISIGKPIAVAGREADELMREVQAWIESEMRRLDAEAYAAEPVASQRQNAATRSAENDQQQAERGSHGHGGIDGVVEPVDQAVIQRDAHGGSPAGHRAMRVVHEDTFGEDAQEAMKPPEKRP